MNLNVRLTPGRHSPPSPPPHPPAAPPPDAGHRSVQTWGPPIRANFAPTPACLPICQRVSSRSKWEKTAERKTGTRSQVGCDRKPPAADGCKTATSPPPDTSIKALITRGLLPPLPPLTPRASLGAAERQNRFDPSRSGTGGWAGGALARMLHAPSKFLSASAAFCHRLWKANSGPRANTPACTFQASFLRLQTGKTTFQPYLALREEPNNDLQITPYLT